MTTKEFNGHHLFQSNMLLRNTFISCTIECLRLEFRVIAGLTDHHCNDCQDTVIQDCQNVFLWRNAEDVVCLI